MAASKSIDIAKNGVQPPLTMAKPIIVTNKPQVADSTLTTTTQNPTPPEQPAVITHSANTITPPEGTEQRIADEQKKDNSESEVVDAIVEEAVKNKKAETKDPEQLAAYQKLIDDKTYFVKVNENGSGSPIGKMFLTLIVAILFVSVLLNFLVDAQILDIGVNPLTNLL